MVDRVATAISVRDQPAALRFLPEGNRFGRRESNEVGMLSNAGTEP
jgi:hypothetical protein